MSAEELTLRLVAVGCGLSFLAAGVAVWLKAPDAEASGCLTSALIVVGALIVGAALWVILGPAVVGVEAPT